jgi:hypothetical protein
MAVMVLVQLNQQHLLLAQGAPSRGGMISFGVVFDYIVQPDHQSKSELKSKLKYNGGREIAFRCLN